MIEIRPITQAVGDDNPDRQISVSQWNNGHILTASPGILIGTDGTGLQTERIIGADPGEILDRAAGDSLYALIAHHHPISDVDGLQAALDAKADDTDLAGYATDAELAAGLSGKSDVGHHHVIADVDGLQGALDSKAPASALADYVLKDGDTMTGPLILDSPNFIMAEWLRAGDASYFARGDATVTAELYLANDDETFWLDIFGFTPAQGIIFGAGTPMLFQIGHVDKLTIGAAAVTATVPVVVPAEVYGASWAAKLEAPTKKDIYDKIQTLGSGGGGAGVDDTPYGPTWDGVTTIAPSKNAVYDKIQALTVGGGSLTDGDYGDVRVSGGGAAMTVESAAGNFVVSGNITAFPTGNANATVTISPNGTGTTSTLFLLGAGQDNALGLRIIALGGAAYYDANTHYFRDVATNNRAVISATGLAVTGNVTATGQINAPLIESGAATRILLQDAAGMNYIDSFANAGHVGWAPLSIRSSTLSFLATPTVDGQPLATVSQLANYLPLTGGIVSGLLYANCFDLFSGAPGEYGLFRSGSTVEFRTGGNAAFKVVGANVAILSASGLAVTGNVTTTAGQLNTGTVTSRWENTIVAPPAGSTGVGLEIFGSHAGGTASAILAYNRTTAANSPLKLMGSGVTVGSYGADWAEFTPSGLAVTGTITATGKITAGGGLKTGNGLITRADDNPIINAVVGNSVLFYSNSNGGYSWLDAANTTQVSFDCNNKFYNFNGGIGCTGGQLNTGTVISRWQNSGASLVSGYSGIGLEIIGSQGGVHSILMAFNRTTGVYSPLHIDASDVTFNCPVNSSSNPLATVSQLANYLPLTGGTLTGGLTASEAGYTAKGTSGHAAVFGLTMTRASETASARITASWPGGNGYISMNYAATLHQWFDLPGTTQVGWLDVNGLNLKGNVVAKGLAHYFGPAAGEPLGDMALVLRTTNYYAQLAFQSAGGSGGAMQDNGSIWGGGLYRFPSHQFQSLAGTLFATIDSTGIDLPAGKTYKVGGVPIGGAGSDTQQVLASASNVVVAVTDSLVSITALAVPVTITAPASGAVDGKRCILRIKDNGVARTINLSTGLRACLGSGTGVAGITVAGKWIYYDLVFNATAGMWDVIRETKEF